MGESRRKELMAIESLANEIIQINPLIATRAKEFENFGVQSFDALHLACSEQYADVLLTVDDKFLKKTAGINLLNITVYNPLVWLNEVLP